ncbi:hypothetical protein EDD16DRAFT_1479918 [Pisolithus croceorrhizus]|nr:hypothetical protein EV401DRAFT_1878882 [Pisolithus croceorrhizus]KAI6119750.1 hypothetical protein EDD16DRAFT_1479918 [Pisolithus croceorrhizus]KAI6161355.1 hypothetical protein EDD17DRAFT_1481812 [Pisolithus thermaeus]
MLAADCDLATACKWWESENGFSNNVQNALNELESTGVFQPSNWMDITELLNPPTEAHNIFDAMDTDIYSAVMEAKKLHKESDAVGSCDDIDVGPIELVPTHNKALQAAHLLQRYMGSLNDPLVHNLELMPGASGQRTCTKGLLNTIDTKIMSYFPHKAQ